MNISIKNKSTTLGSIPEGDLFIYNGKLFLKRTHVRDINTYNVCQIGIKNGGGKLASDVGVTPVNEIVVS